MLLFRPEISILGLLNNFRQLTYKWSGISVPERYDKVRFLRIYAGRLIFSVKVDQRPMPPDLIYFDLLMNKQTFSVVVPWIGWENRAWLSILSPAVPIIGGSRTDGLRKARQITNSGP